MTVTPRKSIPRLAIAVRLLLTWSDAQQRQLAREWECSESTVTRFLAGTATPEPKTMLRIFAWLLETDSLPGTKKRNGGRG